METITVKDLMVPISQYATVSEDATLYEAVMALDKAQREFDQTKYRPRTILVFSKKGQVVGKLTQLGVLRGLEPKYAEMGDSEMLSRSGFSPEFMRSMLDQFGLWSEPLRDICGKSARLKVKNFMSAPSKAEYVEEEATLNEAIHQLIMGPEQSLLVKRGTEIVGVLRVADAFKEVCETTKACVLED